MILVTGATGFVGQKVLQLRSDAIACPSLRDASEEDVARIVAESGADVILHTAAISNVKACQADPEASYRANVRLPVLLAKAAGKAKLICFSSDQVYTGAPEFGPYTEDMAKPANTYARHKLEMERQVLALQPEAVMLRAEWMYDYYRKKSNFLMNILNAEDSLCIRTGQYRGVTYVKEVVENLDAVIRLPGGAYNFGSETTQAMGDITREFLAAIGKELRIEEAPGQHNLWMNCEKARRYGVQFRSVEEGLLRCAADHGLLRR